MAISESKPGILRRIKGILKKDYIPVKEKINTPTIPATPEQKAKLKKEIDTIIEKNLETIKMLAKSLQTLRSKRI